MSLSHFSSEFDKIMKRKYFSSKLHPVRKKAFSKFMDEGLPNQKWEDWRFTDLSAIKNGRFLISEMKDAPKYPINLGPFDIKDVDSIIFYNGHFQKEISSIPDGVFLSSGEEYFEEKNKKIDCAENSPFDLLNTAMMDSGMCVTVNPNTTVTNPLRFLFISDSKNPLMINPRIDLKLEESSSLTFVEHHVGNAPSYFQNESVFVNANNNSFLDHIRIQSNSNGIINMTNIKVKQECDSQYNFIQFSNSGGFGRTNIHCELRGEGAECSLNGLTLSDNKNQIDNHIITEHISPHCISNQNFKTVLKDQSSGVFNSKVIVRNNAQKTDAKQSNKNLLLSKKAVMNSNPQLEINADDVKCAHASTTGELDKEAIFYLRSRGLDTKTSKALLVRGFAEEKIGLIKNENIYNYVVDLFETWIES